jgi:hypothetical protein
MLGYAPAWALGDAGELAAFQILAGIQSITILVDHDVSGTGQRAAIRCSSRWTNPTFPTRRKSSAWCPASLVRTSTTYSAARSRPHDRSPRSRPVRRPRSFRAARERRRGADEVLAGLAKLAGGPPLWGRETEWLELVDRLCAWTCRWHGPRHSRRMDLTGLYCVWPDGTAGPARPHGRGLAGEPA